MARCQENTANRRLLNAEMCAWKWLIILTAHNHVNIRGFHFRVKSISNKFTDYEEENQSMFHK